MLTNQQAEYLLKLNKTLVHPNQIIELSKKKTCLELFSHDDSDYKFRIDITLNQKIILKTSIHHMESNIFIGLLRIDFKGGHKNPSIINECVPEYLIPYADKWFEPTEPHMHIYVENYKPLVWAIPLSQTDFPIKELKDPSDISVLILNFGKKVNLNSIINIQNAIF